MNSPLAPSPRRPEVLAVHSVNRFVVTVPDIGAALRFYEAFGLDVRPVRGGIDLYSFGHPHHWASVVEAGDCKRLQYLSYGIYPEDAEAFRSLIEERRIACAPHSLAQSEGLWLRNPDETPIQLVVAPKVSPSIKSTLAIRAPVPAGKGAASSRSGVEPVHPRHLSHLLCFTPDVTRMVAFQRDVLGLRLSDHSGDIIAFLHTPHGSDHHLVAFAKSHAPGLHHSSWDVASVDEVGLGAEQMRNAGWSEGWGVGRHVLGSNYFNYVQDPWGSFCEYSCDIDFVPHDVDWQAADHDAADSLYVWGPPVPQNFVTNTEHPVPKGQAMGERA